MFSNKELFRAVLYAPLRFDGPEWAHISEQARDFLMQLLERDPAKRPTAEQALQHPWLSQQHHEDYSSSSSSSGNGDGEGSGNGSGSGSRRQLLSDTLVQRLQRFGTYGKLKKVALKEVASRAASDLDVVQQLKAALQTFNAPAATSADGSNNGSNGNGSNGNGNGNGNGSGASQAVATPAKVPYAQVAQVLSSGAYSLSHEEVKALLTQFEVDDDGCVDFYEWAAAVMDWQSVQASESWDEWVAAVFEAFNEDGSGRIGREELTHLLCGEFCLAEDTVPAALREYDLDHDDGIGFEEFAALMRQNRADKLGLFDSRRVERRLG